VREAGFEMGSGFYANPVTPELATVALRVGYAPRTDLDTGPPAGPAGNAREGRRLP
jgi:hypothetical protein